MVFNCEKANFDHKKIYFFLYFFEFMFYTNKNLKEDFIMIKVGVLGAYRGTSMINYCIASKDKAKVVAICDKNSEVLERQKAAHGAEDITYYENFDDFVNHDMDAVVLANYATEHAPFAVQCLKRGLHVFSEVLPCQTMKEAVELIEAVEKSGKVYAYGENYCYMPTVMEMKRLYKQGKIGEIEYGEGEYIHNCESIWASITYGERDHWRNNMYATFYCTHSIGPLIHICELKPVSVVGFESSMTERKLRNGAKSGLFGIEMITLENGAILKSIHGDLYKDSVWYSVYGGKGRIESGRADSGKSETLYVNADNYCGEYPSESRTTSYEPAVKNGVVECFGHGGSDYYIMDNFIDKLCGKEEADIIDVYEAMDMFLPGMFAYRSVLQGGISVQIPNLRDKSVRDKFREDTACTDPNVAKDRLLPVYSKGTPDIPDEIYEIVKNKWEKERADGQYVKAVMKQGDIRR